MLVPSSRYTLPIRCFLLVRTGVSVGGTNRKRKRSIRLLRASLRAVRSIAMAICLRPLILSVILFLLFDLIPLERRVSEAQAFFICIIAVRRRR